MLRIKREHILRWQLLQRDVTASMVLFVQSLDQQYANKQDQWQAMRPSYLLLVADQIPS